MKRVAPAVPREIEKPKLLIGEGREEELFLSALLVHLKITDVQVEEYSGKDKLADYLLSLPKRTGFATLKSIGITRDADSDRARPPAAFRTRSETRNFRALSL